MTHTMSDTSFRVAYFGAVSEADKAITMLLAAGFSKDELAVICPSQCADDFALGVPRAEQPGSHVAEAILEGGAVGAAIGGLGLAAAVLFTGGAALIPAIPVLIGGGAIAGGLSGLILYDGYGNEIGEHYQEAIRLGRIVVGVEVEGEDSAERLEAAARILAAAGGTTPAMMKETASERPDA
ncbi:MAG TPA: hypothetical protein VE988_25760 [Gemmataceae bacterium]|nr:hypothetical protein [Gemmataceae bacterium]